MNAKKLRLMLYFIQKQCTLLTQEVRTSFLGAYDVPSTDLRNHPPLCCAKQHRLLRKGATFVAQQNRKPIHNSGPPNLQATEVKNFAD